MGFSDLTPAELAFLVEDAYLADLSEFSSSVARDYEVLALLHGYLGGKPYLAGLVLSIWLSGIVGPDAPELQLEAERWFGQAILGVKPAN